MQTTRSRPAARAAAATIGALLAIGAAACRDDHAVTGPPSLDPPLAAERGSRDGAREPVGARDAVLGTTPGWAEGKTVQFFYTRNFFCAEPPTSGAPSHCEVGEDGKVDPIPDTEFPVLYVLTPQGFTPPRETLHCPVAGACVAHPSRIDLSRILGPSFSNVLLPAHSHVIERIGDEPGAKEDDPEFWELEVIGVSDPKVWDAISHARNLPTVRAFQRAGKGITDDIPTSTYLFFGVRTLEHEGSHGSPGDGHSTGHP
jgi:hypothetical protein